MIRGSVASTLRLDKKRAHVQLYYFVASLLRYVGIRFYLLCHVTVGVVVVLSERTAFVNYGCMINSHVPFTSCEEMIDIL